MLWSFSTNRYIWNTNSSILPGDTNLFAKMSRFFNVLFFILACKSLPLSETEYALPNFPNVEFFSGVGSFVWRCEMPISWQLVRRVGECHIIHNCFDLTTSQQQQLFSLLWCDVHNIWNWRLLLCIGYCDLAYHLSSIMSTTPSLYFSCVDL